MRKMSAIVLCVLACLLLVFGSVAFADSARDSQVSFSFPFVCETHDGNKTRCLADVFKPGLNTVLLGDIGVCGARTVDSFTFDESHDIKATRLQRTEEYFAVGEYERSFGGFRIAVVGALPEEVRVVPVMKDTSPVPKAIELRARKLAVPHIEEPQKLSDGARVPVSLSNIQPKVRPYRECHTTHFYSSGRGGALGTRTDSGIDGRRSFSTGRGVHL